MNHWAHMLRALPAGAQRLIARANRIALPRGCDAPTRSQRLRQALCHAATVQATYATLPPDVQAALQDLRARRGGISPQELARVYGPVRSWRQLAADPRPQTISEQLLLLGWLIPRPAAPRHPPRYLLPPELRRWAPRPLALLSAGPAPVAVDAGTPPLAVRAAVALLLACAERPLPFTAAGQVRRAGLRALAPRLAPLPLARCAALIAWLVPLLTALGLLAARQGVGTLTLAGQRFLAGTVAQQQAQLQRAWLAHAAPDAWLDRLVIHRVGIDWPLLRRRLCAWAAALPAGQLLDPAALYPALAATLGPLADAQTHGFRPVDRAPWQPRRAAAIFVAALRGPLCWLGLVAWYAAPDAPPLPDGGAPAPGAFVLRLPLGAAAPPAPLCAPPAADAAAAAAVDGQTVAADAAGGCSPVHAPHPLNADAACQGAAGAPAGTASDGAAADPAPPWRYGPPGTLLVPHTAPADATLRLLPFAAWAGAHATATTYQVTPARLARAVGAGWSMDALWTLLERHAGLAPAGWRAGLEAPAPQMRIVSAAVLLAEQPLQLARASRARSVRRYLAQRLAPGIALVQPQHVAPLLRALQRQAIPCAAPPHTAPPTAPAADVNPGDQAALLLACAFYRQHAPADAPLLPDALLEAQLRAGLPPPLREAADAAIAALRPPPPLPVAPALPPEPASSALLLQQLQQALARQRPVELTYDTAGCGTWRRRTVRPLALEQWGAQWYLRAYCSARAAERTFRVDRIGTLQVL